MYVLIGDLSLYGFPPADFGAPEPSVVSLLEILRGSRDALGRVSRLHSWFYNEARRTLQEV